MVAISAYIVADPKSIDGYDVVIAKHLGCSVSDLHTRCSSAANRSFSIIEAVWAQAGRVPYRPVSLKLEEEDFVSRFLRLADRLVDQCAETGTRPLASGILREDEPLGDKVLQKCRDDLRRLIRTLPEVRRFEEMLDSEQGEIQAFPGPYEESMDRLRAIYEELETHARRFEKGRVYHKLFEYSAHGIGGWRT